LKPRSTERKRAITFFFSIKDSANVDKNAYNYFLCCVYADYLEGLVIREKLDHLIHSLLLRKRHFSICLRLKKTRLTKCNPILYPNVHFLLVFPATLPFTTCSAEHTFSSLKRIKTYCRSTMVESRLNGLAAAFIHKNVNINASKILDLFVQKHRRRLDFGL